MKLQRQFWFTAAAPLGLLLAAAIAASVVAATRGRRPDPETAALRCSPAVLAERVVAADRRFNLLRDAPDDADGAVFLCTPAGVWGDRDLWDGMVLVEEDGHPARTRPEAETKGAPVWRTGTLTFYGDPAACADLRRVVRR